MSKRRKKGDKPEPNGRETPDPERRLAELLAKQSFASDELSPPVDYDMLAAFSRRELDDDEIERVCHLIASFRPWHDAWTELRRKIARKKKR
jgi:hypothetical protein